ncbi:MAG TPA: MBL fold metallo-hydrolase [Xanthobacteraceae bacterium]|jgi:glyoxylase-like metal-dependent hydrolase (beta-lactamase superfamily II)|nr:MBL fold metallo-hydrolase [Xanthobacteraceae bacterium]
MSFLTRRRFLAGSAGAAGATVLAGGAAVHLVQASAPMSGKQAPGFYRQKIGDFEMTIVTDGSRTFPMPDGFVKNVSKDKAIAAAEAAYMPMGQITVPFNPVVINTGSKLVLIDAGNGANAGTAGKLMPNLAAAGIDPKAIDIVVISHMHPDHINGIKTPEGALAFPNAEIKVPAVDWAYWMDDAKMAKAPEGMTKNYFNAARKVFSDIAGKVTKYEWSKEVAPGITAINANGHTPGHTAFAVVSGSSKILVQSDVSNIPDLFLRNPDWHVMFDSDPVQAAKMRHKIYDMAAAEKMLVTGFHFPFPAVGHVEKDGSRYRLVPITWNGAI